jgi:hypothetical protein
VSNNLNPPSDDWNIYTWMREIRKSPYLSRTASHVGLVLAGYMDKRGTCYPRIALIAEDARRSRSTIQRTLRELEKAGHVVREVRRGSSTVYWGTVWGWDL